MDRVDRPGRGGSRTETDGPLPTLRTLGGHVLWIVCNGCQHAVEADQPMLIAAGRGDVPVVDLRFRCSACGSRNTGAIVSGSRIGGRE
jgi:hypothetical protein